MMNNRREFLKKSIIFGALGFFAPTLIKSAPKPKFDYGYYPISKIPKFEYIFDNWQQFVYGNKYIYQFWNSVENIVVDMSSADRNVYLRDGNEWIKLKDFSISFHHELTSVNVFGESKPIGDVELIPPKIKVEYYIA